MGFDCCSQTLAQIVKRMSFTIVVEPDEGTDCYYWSGLWAVQLENITKIPPGFVDFVWIDDEAWALVLVPRSTLVFCKTGQPGTYEIAQEIEAYELLLGGSDEEEDAIFADIDIQQRVLDEIKQTLNTLYVYCNEAPKIVVGIDAFVTAKIVLPALSN